jgi:hypothetical protein
MCRVANAFTNMYLYMYTRIEYDNIIRCGGVID